MLVKVIILSLTAVFLCTFLKQYKPEYMIFVSIAAGICIFGMISESLHTVYVSAKETLQLIDADSELSKCVIKIAGISYIRKFSCDLCEDNGHKYLSGKIDTAARVILAALILPYIKDLYVYIIKLL